MFFHISTFTKRPWAIISFKLPDLQILADAPEMDQLSRVSNRSSYHLESLTNLLPSAIPAADAYSFARINLPSRFNPSLLEEKDNTVEERMLSHAPFIYRIATVKFHQRCNSQWSGSLPTTRKQLRGCSIKIKASFPPNNYYHLNE